MKKRIYAFLLAAAMSVAMISTVPVSADTTDPTDTSNVIDAPTIEFASDGSAAIQITPVDSRMTDLFEVQITKVGSENNEDPIYSSFNGMEEMGEKVYVPLGDKITDVDKYSIKVHQKASMEDPEYGDWSNVLTLDCSRAKKLATPSAPVWNTDGTFTATIPEDATGASVSLYMGERHITGFTSQFYFELDAMNEFIAKAMALEEGIYTLKIQALSNDLRNYVSSDDSALSLGYDTATGKIILDSNPDDSNDSQEESKFIDVKKRDFYFDSVAWAIRKDITKGTTDKTFSPDKSCTRGQAVTFLWRAAGSPEPNTTQNPFTDVKEKDFYYKAVLWAAENGITSGTSATRFSPDKECTRAQIVTFMHRQDGDQVRSTNTFNDVAPNSIYADSIGWAVQNGITNGTTATTFSPDKECTRAQIVTFLYRYYE